MMDLHQKTLGVVALAWLALASGCAADQHAAYGDGARTGMPPGHSSQVGIRNGQDSSGVQLYGTVDVGVQRTHIGK